MTGRWLALIALIVLSPALHAERVEQLPVPLPASHVADPRGLLAADTRAELDRLASTLDRAGQGELGFVVISTTGGVDPRRFATDVFNRWGIGDRQRNDGTLILLAKDDRAAEIVLGTGIDTAVNRQHAERVMQDAMVPRFRDGNYDPALVAGTTQLLQRIYAVDLSRPVEQAPADSPAAPAGLVDAASLSADSAAATVRPPSVEYTVQPAAATAPAGGPLPRTQTQTDEPASTGIMAAGLAVIAAVLGAALWLVHKFLRMLWWFTGSRWFTRKCGNCNNVMQQLPEAEDDAHLNPSQLTEERLSSVDHRVFLCPRCSKVEQIARRAWFTRYSDCKACHSRALSSVSKTLTAATRYSTGLAEVTETCQNCNQVRTENRVLPMLPPPSSSSSSSSSYGGGRSSGGGASGRW